MIFHKAGQTGMDAGCRCYDIPDYYSAAIPQGYSRWYSERSEESTHSVGETLHCVQADIM
jgi:hypothetical protein